MDLLNEDKSDHSSDSGPDSVFSDQATSSPSPTMVRKAPSPAPSQSQRLTRLVAKKAPSTELPPTTASDKPDHTSGFQARSTEKLADPAVKVNEEEKPKVASRAKPESSPKNQTPDEKAKAWDQFMDALNNVHKAAENLKLFSDLLRGDIGEALEYASFFVYHAGGSDDGEAPFDTEEVMGTLDAMDSSFKELQKCMRGIEVRLLLAKDCVPPLPWMGGKEQ